MDFRVQRAWLDTLSEKISLNLSLTKQMIAADSKQLNYYQVFDKIVPEFPRDCIIISEGSNTMDIGRTMIPNYLPKHRLDAGTFGTMGVGPGMALAAAVWCRDYHPEKRVICVEGDSAFGFSAMEVETICRYSLPVIIVLINNNGIAIGTDAETFKQSQENDPTIALSPSALAPNSRYEKIMEAFGGLGLYVNEKNQLKPAIKKALSSNTPSLINIIIEPYSSKKPQDFFWLSSGNPSKL